MASWESSSGEEFASLMATKAEYRGNDRVNVYFDVDSFEYQVWIKNKYPEYEQEGRNNPIIIINQDYIILSVNYAAKLVGITRKMSLKRAKDVCFEETGKNLIVLTAGTKEGLIDSETRLRESDKILGVLRKYQEKLRNEDQFVIERSSIDEVYIDVTRLVDLRMSDDNRPLPTQNEVMTLTRARKELCHSSYAGNHVVVLETGEDTICGSRLSQWIQWMCKENLGEYDRDIRLTHGAIIAQELMEAILEETGYEVSFGIALNKLRAKIACGLNKPQGITIITHASPGLLRRLKFKNLPGFGGRIGEELRERYDIVTLEDVLDVGLDSLERKIGRISGVENPLDVAADLMRKAELKDYEVVQTRYYTDTINQSISFKGRYTAQTRGKLEEDIKRLSRCFVSKLKYQRKAHNRLATFTSVRVTLKPKTIGTPGSQHNILEIPDGGRPSTNDIYSFVLDYIDYHGIRPEDLEGVFLKASGFVNY